MKVGLKGLVAVAALGTMVFSAVSQAAVYRWSFSSSSPNSNGVFAFLDFDSSNGNFRLYDNWGQVSGVPTNGFLNTGASDGGVNGISFNFENVVSLGTSYTSGIVDPSDNASLIFSSANSTATSPTEFSGIINSFAAATNGTDNEINANESTTFDFDPSNSGLIAFSNIKGVAIRLNTNNGGGGGALSNADANKWIVGTLMNNGSPVPEAETSAILKIKI